MVPHSKDSYRLGILNKNLHSCGGLANLIQISIPQGKFSYLFLYNPNQYSCHPYINKQFMFEIVFIKGLKKLKFTLKIESL